MTRSHEKSLSDERRDSYLVKMKITFYRDA